MQIHAYLPRSVVQTYINLCSTCSPHKPQATKPLHPIVSIGLLMIMICVLITLGVSDFTINSVVACEVHSELYIIIMKTNTHSARHGYASCSSVSHYGPHAV